MTTTLIVSLWLMTPRAPPGGAADVAAALQVFADQPAWLSVHDGSQLFDSRDAGQSWRARQLPRGPLRLQLWRNLPPTSLCYLGRVAGSDWRHVCLSRDGRRFEPRLAWLRDGETVYDVSAVPGSASQLLGIWRRNQAAGRTHVVVRSADGGRTWRYVPAPLGAATSRLVAVDAAGDAIILAGDVEGRIDRLLRLRRQARAFEVVAGPWQAWSQRAVITQARVSVENTQAWVVSAWDPCDARSATWRSDDAGGGFVGIPVPRRALWPMLFVDARGALAVGLSQVGDAHPSFAHFAPDTQQWSEIWLPKAMPTLLAAAHGNIFAGDATHLYRLQVTGSALPRWQDITPPTFLEAATPDAGAAREAACLSLPRARSSSSLAPAGSLGRR